MLFYTFLKRDANEVLISQVKNIKRNVKFLDEMKNFVEPFREIINIGKNLNLLGEILNSSWKLKKSLSNNISNKDIENIIRLLESGAIGGKVLGAGRILLLFANKRSNL